MADADVLDALRGQIAALESQRPGRQTFKNKTKPKRRSATVETDSKPDALKKIVALVNVSDRSVHAVRERLDREGFDAQIIEEAVQRAIDYGYLDDNRYAKILIRSRLSQGKGIAGIRRELQMHDIDLDSVEGWPEDFEDLDEEYERALAYLRSHPTRSKNRREGAYRKLVQKGYSSDTASRAARVWSEGV